MTVLLCGGAVAAGCTPQALVEECADEHGDATLNVAGVFRYAGNGANAETGGSFNLSGTITFEQQDNLVRVTDTTYDLGGLRRLESEFAEVVSRVRHAGLCVITDQLVTVGRNSNSGILRSLFHRMIQLTSADTGRRRYPFPTGIVAKAAVRTSWPPTPR